MKSTTLQTLSLAYGLHAANRQFVSWSEESARSDRPAQCQCLSPLPKPHWRSHFGAWCAGVSYEMDFRYKCDLNAD